LILFIWTGDQEVESTSLTYCAAEYGIQQARTPA